MSLSLIDYTDNGEFVTATVAAYLAEHGEIARRTVDITMHKDYEEWGLCTQFDDGTEWGDNADGREWAEQQLELAPGSLWRHVLPLVRADLQP